MLSGTSLTPARSAGMMVGFEGRFEGGEKREDKGATLGAQIGCPRNTRSDEGKETIYYFISFALYDQKGSVASASLDLVPYFPLCSTKPPSSTITLSAFSALRFSSLLCTVSPLENRSGIASVVITAPSKQGNPAVRTVRTTCHSEVTKATADVYYWP